MQSFKWYVQRLKSMSPKEIAWRCASMGRDTLDQIWYRFGKYPPISLDEKYLQWSKFRPGFRTIKTDIPDGSGRNSYDLPSEWISELVKIAEQILEHNLSYFNLKQHFHGRPINWNYDHGAGKSASIEFATKIDYRDFDDTGDCKLVWEPNRHHHLVVLGRAYRATGQIKYAQEIVDQIESWLQQCPEGIGMNWRSPMELSIRMINWVWSLDLIYDTGLINSELGRKILYSVYVHLWEVTRKFSRGSSANNHLIGEAAGVYIAASYFNHFPKSVQWRSESKKLMIEEIFNQSFADGGGREQAFGYQLFVLQFFLFASIVGKKIGDEYPQNYWNRMEKMLEFLSIIAEGGEFPKFGDCDDGYVLDLGNRPDDLSNLVCIGAILFGRSDFKSIAGKYREAAFWLLGSDSRNIYDELEGPENLADIGSVTLKHSGYYLLQSPLSRNGSNASVIIDCGELGFGSIAAHGHADALSFVLRINGKSIFIDPGTYDYFTHPEWRNYFRSTRAHNTVAIDGEDQSEMTGPFIWGCKAEARCLHWSSKGNSGTFIGEHTGYRRLSDPLIHKRIFHLDRRSQALLIRDLLECKGVHDATVCFHISGECEIRHLNRNSFEIETNDAPIHFQMDPQLSIELHHKEMDSKWGWESNGYHQKKPATTIVGRCKFRGDKKFSHRILIQ